MATVPTFNKPIVDGDIDIWGEKLNVIIDQQDTFNNEINGEILGGFKLVEDTGSANTLIIEYTGYSAYVDGDKFCVKVKTTNTGASTVKIEALATKSLKKSGGDSLSANNINENQYILIIYDGTNDRFEIVGSAGSIGDGFINLSDTSITANTVTCALTGYIAYSDRDKFAIRVNNDNTGSVNINIETLGNKELKKACGSLSLDSGDLLEDCTILIEYNSALDCFELLSNSVSSIPSKSIYDLTDTSVSANSIVCAKVGYTNYTDRDRFSIRVAQTNNGNVTINIESVGAKSLKKFGGREQLDSGDIKSNSTILVEFNSTLDCFEIISPVVSGMDYYVDGGSVNTIIITTADGSFVEGRLYLVKILNTNTASSSFVLAGVGTKTIKKNQNLENLTAGDLVAGSLVLFGYNGTHIQVLSGLKGLSGGGLNYYSDVSTDGDLVEITTSDTSYVDGSSYLVKVVNNLNTDCEFKITGLSNLVLKKAGITNNISSGDVLADTQILISINTSENVAQVISGLSSGGNTFTDDVFKIQNSVDNTKQIAFSASEITTTTTRTINVPDRNLTLDTLNGSTLFTQVTTPDNPSVGNNKLYFKNDDKLYKLTSGGTESEIGVGGGLPSGVQGDVLYHNGSDWVVLEAGNSGQYLQTQGGSANPQWATVANDDTQYSIAVDMETKILDSFSENEYRAMIYEYVIFKDSNRRMGVLYICWNPSTDAVQIYDTVKTTDIGTVDVTLSADISANSVRFKATGTSSGWTVVFRRRDLSGIVQASGRGLFGGGSAGANSNVIDYVTISTTGNAVDFGDLTVARHALASCSNSTRGLFGGGADSNIIDYVTISTTGNAVDFGDLTVARGALASCSNSTRGLFGGGVTGTRIDVIDYVTISTTGNAVDFGDLTVARHYLAACSNSHGGL